METKRLQSWDEFEDTIKLFDKREGYPYKPGTEKIIYRGQSDAQWHLTTTLERYMKRETGSNKLDMISYYDMMSRAKSRIETFTANSWELIDSSAYSKWANDSQFLSPSQHPSLEYMAYLRHHGYPSPLLDWSLSPFVAAYFAFRDVISNAESVAIFAYSDMPFDGKFVSEDEPGITSIEQDIKSDRRHFLQQSTYTICTIKEGGRRYYHNHEDVFTQARSDQDLLWKFIIPSSERKYALRKLDTYNINAYSIFQSEDSILETVFLRDYARDWFS